MAVTLLLAVLLSGLAQRTILSTAVLFLAAGFIAGPGMLGWVHQPASDPVVATLVELALVSVLFTDGMHLGVRDLVSAWHLPGRALLLGLPLTLLGTALAGHWVVGLTWPEAFLVGAVLSPTDPVFAAAIVGREEIPWRLRRLLNVESGLNDGLALPLVLGMLAFIGQSELQLVDWLSELILGVVLGVAVPWLVIKLERSRFFEAARIYQPLLVFAIGLLVYALAAFIHANLFLAAYAAGVTVASLSTELRDAFFEFGELVAELLKLAALFVFGTLISFEVLLGFEPADYLFVGLVLLAVRPLALGGALLGSGLKLPETVAAAWFGPKGFASVVYGLFVLRSGLPGTETLFHLIALVVVGSILAHSSTDTLIADWFQRITLKPKEAAPVETGAES
jgi:NhaP-type Na+/H+ or K+/H+ antiporter